MLQTGTETMALPIGENMQPEQEDEGMSSGSRPWGRMRPTKPVPSIFCRILMSPNMMHSHGQTRHAAYIHRPTTPESAVGQFVQKSRLKSTTPWSQYRMTHSILPNQGALQCEGACRRGG